MIELQIKMIIKYISQVVLLLIGLPLFRVVVAPAVYECGGSSIEWFVGH